MKLYFSGYEVDETAYDDGLMVGFSQFLLFLLSFSCK